MILVDITEFVAYFVYCIIFSEAESLCNRLTEKANVPHGHRLVLAHMPLLLVCLEVSRIQF